jgi:hypothetical protein
MGWGEQGRGPPVPPVRLEGELQSLPKYSGSPRLNPITLIIGTKFSEFSLRNQGPEASLRGGAGKGSVNKY